MKNKAITLSKDPINKTSEIIKEIYQGFYDIPFGNSKYQIENFIIGGEITPERAYRAIGINLIDKLTNLYDILLEKEMLDFLKEELYKKANDLSLELFERKRAEIDLKKLEFKEPYNEKLLNDAIEELNILYYYFKKMPKYTREQFENGERNHYLEKLNREINNLNGAGTSLINMNNDLPDLIKYVEQLQKLPKKEQLKIIEESKNTLFDNMLVTKMLDEKENNSR